MTNLVTFYGASLRTFLNLNDYNWNSFQACLMSKAVEHAKSCPWKMIHPGKCEGILTGGYLVNYAALQGLKYFRLTSEKKYILFIEDHEKFSSPAVVSKWFTNLEHRGVFDHVNGLIFGHYSNEPQPDIDAILLRLGQRYQIPVVRCEDFGHGIYNAVIPIGISAVLDTINDNFEFRESAVL